MKKYLFTLLTIIMCIFPYSTAFAADNQMDAVNTGSEQNITADSNVSVVFVPEYEFTIVSTRLDNTDNVQLENIEWSNGNSEINSRPEKEVSAKFTHKIYDRNKKLMATATVTVEGVYSQVDRWSEITSVSATFSGEFKNDFSYSSSTSGNKGYLDIIFNGVTVNTQTYTISTNGRISNK
ncbi:hypothetical protein [Clostridium sp. Marseille-P2415]|uniref:hypothetical protein n=1 Tax=Clostridium sp. Marseille-P2415 TaxID=1805471 RepID=UPI0009885EE5|nr:hypothetical protein [Clostridium sp. Marseille-P2415]